LKSSTAHYPKQHMFVKKKGKKTRRRKRTCTRETKSFPFPLWKRYWTGCCWPLCGEFRLIWKCEPACFKPSNRVYWFKLTCHINKTIHTLTTITIIIELSGRGACRWYERCGGWNKNATSSEYFITRGVDTDNRRRQRKTRVVSLVMGQAGCPGREPDCLKPSGTWVGVSADDEWRRSWHFLMRNPAGPGQGQNSPTHRSVTVPKYIKHLAPGCHFSVLLCFVLVQGYECNFFIVCSSSLAQPKSVLLQHEYKSLCGWSTHHVPHVLSALRTTRTLSWHTARFRKDDIQNNNQNENQNGHYMSRFESILASTFLSFFLCMSDGYQ